MLVLNHWLLSRWYPLGLIVHQQRYWTLTSDKNVGPLDFSWSTISLNYLAFQPFNYEHTWWRSFYKSVMHTKIATYILIKKHLFCLTLVAVFQLKLFQITRKLSYFQEKVSDNLTSTHTRFDFICKMSYNICNNTRLKYLFV
jgi:hypothetical protein